ncbi:MAG: hypothetical protein HZA88_19765 [Verrucomicrobia bacterium]|nr:hypothetical protein [Verrucomicrobiota bacterium]
MNCKPQFEVVGYDTFSGEYYHVSRHFFLWTARIAGRLCLWKIRRMQPDKTTGGQAGIQDKVFIMIPKGEMINVRP